MSRHPMIEDKDWIVKRLKEVEAGKRIKATYHLQRVLEDNKYIKPVYEKKGTGRGRTSKHYVLFGRGKKLINKLARERADARAAKEAANSSSEGATPRVVAVH